jgi:hypothetical protein
LYIDYLKEQLQETPTPEAEAKRKKYFSTFYQNLKDGINYYRQLPAVPGQVQFSEALDFAALELDSLNYQYSIQKDVLQYS